MKRSMMTDGRFGNGLRTRLLVTAVAAGLLAMAGLAPADAPPKQAEAQPAGAGAAPAATPTAAGSPSPGAAQTSAPTTQTAATTQPATQPSASVHVVKKGSLKLTIDSAGTFQPVEPFEVRIRPDQYKGELKIVSAAEHGKPVKKGNILIEFATEDIRRDITAAENDLTTARATYAKAEADARLGEQADALAMKIQEEALSNAEANLRWWDEMVGPQMLLMAELRLKQSRHNVEDQEDELEQLRKMYKSEELTTDTADIVIKRALRSLEQSKVMTKVQEEQERKTRTFDHANSREQVEFALQQARQQMAQLQVAQSHAKVLRQTGLTSARLALNAAEKKAAELKGDLEKLKVTAPADGILFYGSMSGAAFQAGDPKTLKPGEKANPNMPLMTLFVPGKVRVALDIPETKLSWVEPGMKATVNPVAWPGMNYEGKLAEITPVGKAGGAEQSFGLLVDLSDVDSKIRPGMKAQVKLEPKKVEDVLVVPTAAVSGGKVKVKGKDGTPQEREVKVGRSDGQQVEVLNGLEEGDEIVLGGGGAGSGSKLDGASKPDGAAKSEAAKS